MNAVVSADTRRRTTLAAVAFAVAIGLVSLIFANGRNADAVPAAAAPAMSPAAAIAPAVADTSLSAAVDAAAAPAATLPGGTATTGQPAPTDPAAAEDPLAGVIVEPVDPAEALFGEQAAAVATSN